MLGDCGLVLANGERVAWLASFAWLKLLFECKSLNLMDDSCCDSVYLVSSVLKLILIVLFGLFRLMFDDLVIVFLDILEFADMFEFN